MSDETIQTPAQPAGPALSMVAQPTGFFEEDGLVDLHEELIVPGETTRPEGAFSEAVELGTKLSVDDVLALVGRRGGPSEYGWHTLAAGFYCAREAHFNAFAPTGDEDSMALAVGSVAHEYLAEHYACHMEGRPLAEAREKVEKTHALLHKHGYEKAADEARRIYYAYWTSYVEGYDWYAAQGKVVAVEKKMYREFPWGQRYSCRADVVIHMPDGYLIVDHKTAREEKQISDDWALDPGMIGLEWVAPKYYRPIIGYSINGVVKLKQPKFKRVSFASSRRLVRDWLAMMKYRHLEQQIAEQAGYPANFAQCVRRYRRCQWFGLCVHGLRPETRRAAAPPELGGDV